MSLWQDVRSQIVDWYVVAAERTEEWAQLGVRHYDRFGVHRRLAREFTNLGGELHSILSTGEYPELAKNEAMAPILAKIELLEQELRAKDEEIAALRRRERAQRSGAAAGGSEANNAAGDDEAPVE